MQLHACRASAKSVPPFAMLACASATWLASSQAHAQSMDVVVVDAAADASTAAYDAATAEGPSVVASDGSAVDASAVSVVDAAVPSSAPLPVEPLPREAAPIPPPVAGVPAPREQGVRVIANPSSAPRGASDQTIPIGRLLEVPTQNAGDLLRLAPGIFLVNGLGEGHAEQIFLRGFDARFGQDLAFSVDGVPVNEPGHPHGHGYADTHWVIPEVVDTLRVQEGPFDPRQGDFAVAGSALYSLGVRTRGARVQYRVGSFGTHRLVGVFAPEGELRGTYVAAELARSDGYGDNRSFERASANLGYERVLGSVRVRVSAASYLTRYGSAGVVREDDVRSGRVGFFGTYDRTQGGDSTRHGLSLSLDSSRVNATLWATYRTYALRENYTGFLLDTQRAGQSPHGQRGDAIAQSNQSFDLGAQAHTKLRTTLRALPQTLEVGVFGRFVQGDVTQQRLRAGTVVPYATDFDFVPAMANVAMYADGELRPWWWLTLRGGLRVDAFHYNVLDRCAVRGTYVRGAPLDAECLSVDRAGYRSPTSRSTAMGLLPQPRAVLAMGPFAGLTFSLAYGSGARSVDATYLADGERAPFSPIQAGEVGATLHRHRGAWTVDARALGYITHVERDLIFDEAQGRNGLANGTTRGGALAALRVSHPRLDLGAHVTYAHAVFDDTGLVVPYVPPLVARVDAALNWPLPLKIRDRRVTLQAATGLTFVSPRPLPFSEFGELIATADANVSLRWTHVEIGLFCTNLFDAQYAWGQFNFVSDFMSQEFATRVATRHFSVAPPRQLALTVTMHLGADAARHGADARHTDHSVEAP
ncbi:MAG: TonB-dependent receptor plug domain-containing protein [Deltaproteobacteria bacterium]|nr:TonB-dependent receptor plug domain-containing protein [Deltaproteobacteria bacterium]